MLQHFQLSPRLGSLILTPLNGRLRHRRGCQGGSGCQRDQTGNAESRDNQPLQFWFHGYSCNGNTLRSNVVIFPNRKLKPTLWQPQPTPEDRSFGAPLNVSSHTAAIYQICSTNTCKQRNGFLGKIYRKPYFFP